MSLGLKGRALHFVFKIGDRAESAKFYRDILGMKVLRHEEFSEGCEATCNGPYQNRWSKTMVGYGAEDTHFVLELVYNYGVKEYQRGNDFLGIWIKSTDAIVRAKAYNWPMKAEKQGFALEAPGGYPFYIEDGDITKDEDPIQQVTLASSDVLRTTNYWNGLLGLKIYQEDPEKVILGYSDKDVKLKFVKRASVVREKAYGRIAFSIPGNMQKKLEERMKETKNTILTPLTSLDTPGKATVSVIILADPDDHEICFVDDENFRKLSEYDPESNGMLNRYIMKDKSMAK
ncbi:glyoxalase domain-containing protein 4 [Cimex lectularius]|uniref:VOC domain-containing protein n=1 Tax=Cimex lectularius TaxID=79782 RepID=A0A8I6TCY9_CIMLE|nr:glyoxalase domain-containing protein 4 [Cimex lectularius]XP_024085443.1 glyoxalase domain-containing protein 4 [Cimex lectularius]